ncbi:hypothetical protein Tco_0386354 [Tanacetum coccineum]
MIHNDEDGDNDAYDDDIDDNESLQNALGTKFGYEYCVPSTDKRAKREDHSKPMENLRACAILLLKGWLTILPLVEFHTIKAITAASGRTI